MKKNPVAIIDYTTVRGKRLFERILSNRQKRDAAVAHAVGKIIRAVQRQGDTALFAYTRRFDKMRLSARTVRITQSEIERQARKTPRALQKTMREAAKRIRAFHMRQRPAGFSMKTGEGTLAQLVRPLERVAVYVPGGHTVYPSSVLMNVIPAQVAGVHEIVAVTPPRGALDPGIAFALSLCAVREVYRIGGSHAIAALAFGTQSIRRVDKIVGPGNAYVAAAKRQVYGAVDIDAIAGPSEVVIIADDSVSPRWVALDLLAQAEHGSGDEFALCVTEDAAFAREIALQTATEMKQSPVGKTLERLPDDAIAVVRTESRNDSIAIVNAVAPEHLQIMTGTARQDLKKVRNAAAVFIGPHTPVALGDYFIGTNHVLPTGGAARFASPLGVESFMKRISVAEVQKGGLRKAAPYVSIFARAEHFIHHAMSVEQRV
ncbi:MAG: histidinol dehydrogenase [Chitinispirillaceae bacterium]|nr:histidinol dehydrogenase [Chitinispirillaceae bacterium]